MPHSNPPFCHVLYGVGAHDNAAARVGLDDVVVVMVVALGPHEQAELYADGAEPQADVNRGLNPVVAVITACVYD